VRSFSKAEQLREDVPRPARPPTAPTWFWCSAGCGTGIVAIDGDTCLACRMGWTPDAAEIARIEREYPKG
jgi:hypothetical protein